MLCKACGGMAAGGTNKRPYCRTCRNVKARETYAKDPSKDRNRQLKRRYGLTLDDYNTMYAVVDGNCEICGEHKNMLYVDHNHKTNKVRGLLCALCNAFLGKVDKNKEILVKMKHYHGGHHKG